MKPKSRRRSRQTLIITIIIIITATRRREASKRTDDEGLLGLRSVLVVPGRPTRRVDGSRASAEQRRLCFTQGGGALPARSPGRRQEAVQRVLAAPAGGQPREKEHPYKVYHSSVIETQWTQRTGSCDGKETGSHQKERQ